MLQVEQLIQRVKAYQPSVDSELIQRAYDYSFRMHSGQTRKSGEPYIVHPISVAGIITDAPAGNPVVRQLRDQGATIIPA